MSNLQNEISSLSPAEKFDSIDLQSQQSKETAPIGEQQAELDSRAADYERNPGKVISWEQVKAGLSKRQ